MNFNGQEIKAIIFDMDGTLIDSTGLWHEIDVQFFKKRGFPDVPPEFLQIIVHMGLVEGASMTIERYGLVNDTPEGVIKEWNDASYDAYANKIPLKEGAIEVLKFFRSKGIKLALATANDENLYKPCAKRLDIEKYFDLIVDVKTATEGKSSPKIYDYCADKFNVKKEETIVVEDTLVGLTTAYKNGYYAVAIYDKASEPIDDQKHANCKVYVNCLKDLVSYVK